MADAISIQELIDARTDAKTLEEAVNGDAVTTVLSRLGETYPTLSNALNQIDSKLDSADTQIKQGITSLFENGGLPATPFATKALMTASALVDGQYAMVTDDADLNSNGLFIKKDGAWEVSRYSIQSILSSYISNDNSENLLVFKDKDGKTFTLVAGDGSWYLSGIEHSVQDYLKNINPDTLSNDDNPARLLTLKGQDGRDALFLLGDGTLVVSDVVTNSVGLNAMSDKLSELESEVRKEPELLPFNSPYRYADGLRVANQEKTNKKVVLADVAEIGNGYQSLWAPCIARTGKNTYYMCFDVRKTGGDFEPIYIAGRTLTYDPATKEFTKGAIQRLSQDGVGADGIPYSYLNPNITYVEKGLNAGRIIINFNYMNNPSSQEDREYLPYYVYSDNGGVSFTAPIAMADMFDFSDVEQDKLMIFGTGHGIQLRYGKYAGRLIIPVYTRNPLSKDKNLYGDRATGSRLVYSDDGGDTFSMGNIVGAMSNTNECQAAELENGSIVIFMRLHSGVNKKYQAYSSDGGISFGKIKMVDDIRGAGTKNGLLQCANNYDYSLPKLMVLSPRAENESGGGRVNPHVWVSYDSGVTYPYRKKIADGICQYTDMQTIDPDHILAAYNGGTHPNGNLIYGHIINLNFLIGEQI